MAKKYKIGDEDEEIKNAQAGDGENNKKVKLGGDDNEPKKKGGCCGGGGKDKHKKIEESQGDQE